MKWIPLSERKPDWFICTTYEHFTDGRTLYYQDSIPEGATHWLEWTIPPIPKPEKPKDPDWEKFEKDFNRMHYDNDEMSDLAACVFAIYRFLKAKYGN